MPDDFDIFIANSVYPDARAIFEINTKLLEEIKDDCIIVLDTNVLLEPYKISSESFQDIKKMYQSLADQERLIVPGQVAREFAKNRAEKLKEIFLNLRQRKGNVSKFDSRSYPILESIEEYEEALELEKEINEKISSYNLGC